MLRALVAGHVCIDLIPELAGPVDLTPGGLVEVGPIALRPGGCVANTGRDLLALGAPAHLVADVGDDEMGRVLRRMLAAAAGDAVALRAVPGQSTSYSLVVQPPGGDRVFWHHVGANASFDGGGIDLAAGDLLHVGYPPLLPALTADCGGAGLRALLSRARAHGLTTSVDLVVVDRASEAGRQDWERILREVLPLVDVFTPSVDDLASALRRDFATSPDGLSDLAGRLVSGGAAIVALTAGPDGLLLRTAGLGRLRSGGPVLAALSAAWADRELWVPALSVQVVSTIGAGDAATAGLLYALLAGLEPEDAALAAAGAAAVKVSGRSRLPHYDDSAIAAASVGAADQPGWDRGRRGVFTGRADRASSTGGPRTALGADPGRAASDADDSEGAVSPCRTLPGT